MSVTIEPDQSGDDAATLRDDWGDTLRVYAMQRGDGPDTLCVTIEHDSVELTADSARALAASLVRWAKTGELRGSEEAEHS